MTFYPSTPNSMRWLIFRGTYVIGEGKMQSVSLDIKLCL